MVRTHRIERFARLNTFDLRRNHHLWKTESVDHDRGRRWRNAQVPRTQGQQAESQGRTETTRLRACLLYG